MNGKLDDFSDDLPLVGAGDPGEENLGDDEAPNPLAIDIEELSDADANPVDEGDLVDDAPSDPEAFIMPGLDALEQQGDGSCDDGQAGDAVAVEDPGRCLFEEEVIDAVVADDARVGAEASDAEAGEALVTDDRELLESGAGDDVLPSEPEAEGPATEDADDLPDLGDAGLEELESV